MYDVFDEKRRIMRAGAVSAHMERFLAKQTYMREKGDGSGRDGNNFAATPSSDNASHSGWSFLHVARMSSSSALGWRSPPFLHVAMIPNAQGRETICCLALEDETETCLKTLKFRLYGIFGEKGRIPSASMSFLFLRLDFRRSRRICKVEEGRPM